MVWHVYYTICDKKLPFSKLVLWIKTSDDWLLLNKHFFFLIASHIVTWDRHLWWKGINVHNERRSKQVFFKRSKAKLLCMKRNGVSCWWQSNTLIDHEFETWKRVQIGCMILKQYCASAWSVHKLIFPQTTALVCL